MLMSEILAALSAVVSVCGLPFTVNVPPGTKRSSLFLSRRFVGFAALALTFMVVSVLKARDDTRKDATARQEASQQIADAANKVIAATAQTLGPATAQLQQVVDQLFRAAEKLRPASAPPLPARLAIAPRQEAISVTPRTTAFWPAGCQAALDTVEKVTMVPGGIGAPNEPIVSERTVRRTPTDATMRRADCTLTEGQIVEIGADRLALGVTGQPADTGQVDVVIGDDRMSLAANESRRAGSDAGSCRVTYSARPTPIAYRFTVDCAVRAAG